MHNYLVLALIIAVTLIPSLVIGAVTSRSIDSWYKGLKKPSWTPPNWLFGPVWTVLYLCMSVAMWLVWRERPDLIWTQRLYLAQLLLNHGWSPSFFLLKKPKLALAVIVALDITVLLTTVLFATVSLAAAKLMLAYLAWISFATLLNYRLWRDNR